MSSTVGNDAQTNGYHFSNSISNNSDDFVITGVSGRFPEANSIDEFAYNLFNGVDMVTADDRRWPEGQYGLPTRNGKLKEVDRFDAAFFNVHPKQAHNMDPQLRLLLEVTYESICDAGINPTKLKGTKTGVFIGASGSDAQTAFSTDPQTLEGYSMTGCATSMFANRLSYFFDFKGPSYTVDTACSSSLLALDCALNALRNGACDAAIVGGVNLCFRPQTSLQFLKLQMLSHDGTCRAFDSSGTGYVRSETVATVFIQKRQDAKRLYATLLHSKTNTDGWKKDGITFPSGEMQKTLLENIYKEIHLDPNTVGYVEAHGTGTRAGDPQEMNSITQVFCNKRQQPLLIGSTKSNMGHPEPASGVAALSKLLVAIQDGHIPANLHFKSPNTDIPGLTDGRLKVVTEKTKIPNNLMSINSFGFGGANVHAVLEVNQNRQENENSSRNQVRVAVTCARTADGCEHILKHLKESQNNIELQALLNENAFHPAHTHPYRGFTLLNSSDAPITVQKCSSERRPVWYIFSGMGTQWSGMGRELMELELFRKSIERTAIVLKKYDIDLFNLILSSKPEDLDKPVNSFVGIAAIQVALVDCLKAMGMEPDGIVGHSVGELGCAYADGCFSAEETVLAAYFRGKCIQEANLPAGGMAAVGLTWAECKEMCPADISPACHNAVDTVTVSGPKQSVENFVSELKEKKIFAKEVACNQVAFHSHYMIEIAPSLRKCLENVIRNPPKQRSSRWISTSVPENRWNTPLALTSSPDYHVNNLCSPVLFQEALQHIPSNALTIELAPHCLLLAILKRSLNTDCVHLNLMKRGAHDHIAYFYNSLGKLYNEGVNLNIMSNYPPVQYPVPVNVPFVSSLIASQWDHSQQWKIPTFEMFTQSLGSAQQAKHEIDLNDGSEYSFIVGHQIDGRCLFPATGYLVLVWKTFAKVHNYEDYRQMSVLFEQVQIHRATICSTANKVIFYVNILPTNGTFEIIENNTIIVTGRISASEQLTMQQFYKQKTLNSHENLLQTNEIYRDFNLRGYEYSGFFRGIKQINIDGTNGELTWNNDWISYLDTMLQVHLIPYQGLQLPTRIDSLRIDPKLHMELISSSSSTSTCPVYVDYWNGLCFSGGIELIGLHCTGTSKKNKQQNTILESYLFTPFNDENVANELDTCLYLVLENILTTTLTLCQIGNEMKLSDEIFNFYSQQPSIKSVEYTLVTSSSTEEINQKINTIENLSSFTTSVDLVIVNKTETNTYDWERLFSTCKTNGFLLLTSNIDLPTNQLENANFIQIVKRKNYQLWKKVSNENVQDIIVNLDGQNFQWIEQIKPLLSNSASQRIWLVSQELDNGILGFFNCLRREPGGQSLRCVQIQTNENILNENVWKTLKTKDLAVNIYQNGIWGSYVHRNLRTSNESSWIETDNAHVNVLNRGDLSSLTWLQSPAITNENMDNNNFDTCTVHYASLNFRDIMLATGKLSPEAIPGYLKMQGCLLGLEFAGLDSTGQPIMGLLSAKGLATQVAIDKRYSWKVPNKWTLEQASTIPVVYSTAYYALVVRGQLKRGEKVLIHAGTGGVGTAAIAIAYSYDCEVFTTVSSVEKREYLKRLFPRLNDEHIANSRDTTFEQQIRFVTKGKGVDIVLNSLAEDKLQASVRLLAQHGRFLEIGKFDLSQNNPLGMGVFLKNTTFHGILLDSLFENASEEWLRVHQLVEQGIQQGVVQPLQCNVFNANEIEQAFRFMSQGKHMGKVVLKVYDESRPLVRAMRKTWFSPNKTYIITGGLGGFGLELTEWLVERGARHLILCSRSGIRTGYQLKKINYLQTFFQANISISKLNIANEKECEELIGKRSLPIGGIFHLAAVLQDGLFENLTVDLFNQVVDIKYNGTKYLDQFTRKYSRETLDYFVVFSSISCGRGNAGQTNYGYANSTMERICEQRQQDGLPALAIQWGAIGDVGMVIENLGSNDTVVGGTLPQRMTSCLETIDYFLQQSTNIPVVSSYVLAEKLQKTSGSSDSSASLLETIANILGISDASTMSPDSTLADLGLDSLGSVEIKQLLEQKYSVSLANSKEIQQMTVKRLKEIDSGSSTATTAATTTNTTDKKRVSVSSAVDLSQLLPTELLVLLNDKVQSKKYQHLFLIHPIEGHVQMLKELAQRIPITVFGLQSTTDVPNTSIEDIAAYYIKKIVETQPTGPYLIGGYSFGACIAVEISLQLSSIAHLLLLDGSHSYVATHTKQYRTKFNEPNHAEAAVLYAFLQQYIPVLDQKKILSELSNLPSYDTRLQYAAELLDKTVNIGQDKIILIAKQFHNKLLLAEKYLPSKKIPCQTTLFRVQTGSEYSDTIGNDYGLSTVCEKSPQVLVIPGDHRTFLQGDNVQVLATQINTILSKDS